MMGNQLSSVDFVTQLPPEILSVVLAYLPLKDVLRCLRVCKRWKETILNLQPYWTNMLVDLNLSQSCLKKYVILFSRRSDIFFVVKRRLTELQPVEFACSSPVCYPAYPVSNCYLMPQQNIVVRTGCNNRSSGLYVERLTALGNVVYTETLFVKAMRESCNIVWGHFSKNYCLYWVDDAVKMGTCYDTVGDQVLYTFDLLNDFLIGGDNSGATFSIVKCCEECSMCVIWYTRPKTAIESDRLHNVEAAEPEKGIESGFDLKVLCLGGTHSRPKVLFSGRMLHKCKHHDHSQPPGVCSRSLQVISNCKGISRSTGDNICSDHSVLLTNSGYHTLISFRNKEHTTENYLQIISNCLSCKYPFLVQGKLFCVGSIFQNFHQHLASITANPTCICNDKLANIQDKTEMNCISVICIGEQLCILRYSNTLEYLVASKEKFYIVHTETGKLYKEVQSNFYFPKSMTNHGGSCYLEYFVTSEAQNWLDDIRKASPVTLFIALLSDGNRRLEFSLVQQKQEKLENPDCVYAVNNLIKS